MTTLTSPTPLPARPTSTPVDGPASWTPQQLGTLEMHVDRTRNAVTTSRRGTQELSASNFLLQGASVRDALDAARDLSRSAKQPVAVLQATDGQVFTALVNTKVNAMNPPFLQLRGAQGALRTEALDYAIRTDLPAGYHDYTATVRAADTDLGRALRAIVTDRSVMQQG